MQFSTRNPLLYSCDYSWSTCFCFYINKSLCSFISAFELPLRTVASRDIEPARQKLQSGIWALFFTVLQKPAGSNLGSFLMIYRNWVSDFLVKKLVFLIKNGSEKQVFSIKNQCTKIRVGIPYQKSVFKNRSSLSKKRVVEVVETELLWGWFLNSFVSRSC